MAVGKGKNQGIVAQGSTIEFDAYFYGYNGGPLVDPSPNPTYVIKDPTGTIVKTSTEGVRQSTGIWHATYDVPAAADLSSNWSIEWDATINGSLITDSELFTVVEPGSIGFGGSVIISDDWLTLIKTVLAAPTLDRFLLTDDQIKSLCVYPVMHEYFSRWPIKVDYQQEVTGASPLEVPFPDDYTFGIIGMNVVGKSGQTYGQGGGSSNFFDILRYQTTGYRKHTGMYGIPGYNPGFVQQSYYDRIFQVASEQNNLSTQDYRVYPHEKKIVINSSVNGKILISWAKYSLDFDADVRFERKMDCIRLAQANLLNHAADTAKLVNDSSLEVNVEWNELRNQAQELRDKVIEQWIEIPGIIWFRQT